MAKEESFLEKCLCLEHAASQLISSWFSCWFYEVPGIVDGVKTAFLSWCYLYERYLRVDGQKLDSVHRPHLPSRPCRPLACQPSRFRLKRLFLVGTEDYQSESASERNNGWVIFRASCFSSKHYRHKQRSSQWIQCCTGSNKSVLYFLLCWLVRGERGWRRLVMEEHIVCFPLLFLKKNDLLKREMVYCLMTLFFLLVIMKHCQIRKGMFMSNCTVSMEGLCSFKGSIRLAVTRGVCVCMYMCVCTHVCIHVCVCVCVLPLKKTSWTKLSLRIKSILITSHLKPPKSN